MPVMRNYIIIGGATKSATTSLFFYLAAHPQVCESSMKETRFFLDTDYPVKSAHRYTDGLQQYHSFFASCPVTESVRVEATPDYLYSPGTPKRIRQSLDGVLMCFILRRPVDRLFSWYKFAVQRSLIPVETSFDEYVQQQLSTDGVHSPDTPQAMRALEQGIYARYLQPYIDVFGAENVCTLLFEDVAQSPQSALGRLCDLAEIDASFYDNYCFAVHNQAKSVRLGGVHHAYITLRSTLRRRTHSHPRLHRSLKRIRQRFDAFYEPFNVKPTDSAPEIAPDTLALLDDYYADSILRLSAMLNRDLSGWTETVRAS